MTTNNWVLFLKQKSKETGISYMCLISNKEIQNEYKNKKKGIQPTKTEPTKKESTKTEPTKTEPTKKEPTKKESILDIPLSDIWKQENKDLWSKEINSIKFLLNNFQGFNISLNMKNLIKKGVVISPSDLFVGKDRVLFNYLNDNNSIRDIHYVFKEIIESEGGKSTDYNKEEEKKYIKRLDRSHKFNQKEEDEKHNEKKRINNILKTVISYIWDEDIYLIRVIFNKSKKYRPFFEKILRLINKGVVISPSDLFVTKEDKSLLNSLFDYNTEKGIHEGLQYIIDSEDGKSTDFTKEEKDKFLKIIT